jgi:hypothetical protein
MFRHLTGVAVLLYGLTAVVGGTYAFYSVGSVPSLIGGGVSGVLLLLCGVGIFKGPKMAFLSLLGALLVSLALVVRFVIAASGHWDNLGAYLETLVGQTAVVMVAGGVVVILLCLTALYRRAR